MGAISSLASVLGISETANPVTAAIAELDPDTFKEKNLQAFQYFPETITDSKSPEWSSQAVPGGSHPIKSFIHGGDRSISFTAVFTQDENPEPQGFLNKVLTGTASLDFKSLLMGSKRKDTVDIAAAVAFLRRFTYPTYKNDVAFPPPFAVVYLPNSGIVGHPNFKDSIVGVMQQCEVTYESFHRDGSPRIVAVSLSFSEIVQIGGAWKFVGAETFEALSSSYQREVIGANPSKNGLLGLGVLGL